MAVLEVGADSPHRRRIDWFDWFDNPLTAPVLAAVLVVVAYLADWQGGDWSGQVYRVTLFRRVGLTVWNAQWYGGHWTLTYSTLFPALAGTIGIYPTAMVSAVAAVWAFDRLATANFGPTARVASMVFTGTVLAGVVIGQLTFLLGLAFGLLAAVAVVAQRWSVAALLAVGTALSSPLAGAFLGLAVVAYLCSEWPRHRAPGAVVAAAALAPVVAMALLFPRQGSFPFRWGNLVGLVATCVGFLLIVPWRDRGLRVMIGLYGLVLLGSFILPTPVGANADRLARYFALPLLVCLTWPKRVRILALGAIPFVLLAWLPAWRAVFSDPGEPSATEKFYAPLVAFLDRQPSQTGRVEVVPTRLHWEVAYVAPSRPLARGWERQVDTADNPIFYEDGLLDASSYLAWLRDNGVSFVALPEAPLDYAGEAEGSLVRRGVAGLRLVWRHPSWRVYEVVGSEGIVSGPAELVTLDGGQIELVASGAGIVVVRERATAQWSLVSGPGCILEDPERWLELQVTGPGTIVLELDATGERTGVCESP